MLNALMKLFVPKLNGLLLLALTGFVCTHKIQAEEECLSTVLCYECDSRYDPNCADPFDFSPTATLDPYLKPPTIPSATNNDTTTNGSRQATTTDLDLSTMPNEAKNLTIPQRQPKKLPPVNYCHGCCVKITSKMPDGANYVMRTCTTHLQINYFMVGLVCMKESGDRGKMCFCESDYCNGQDSNSLSASKLYIYLILLYIVKVLIFSS